MNYLKLAIEAALKAGKSIIEIYNSNNFEVKLKSDQSPLTLADTESHNIISQYLNKTKIPILSEEGKNIPYSKRKNWNKLWIIDPIDGTKEFIKKNGEFTVNIALIENQIPEIGVIYAPILKELYFSCKNIGSFKVKVNVKDYDIHDLIENATKLPIERKDSTFTIVASRSHMSKDTEEFIHSAKKKHMKINLISKGSSLKLCMVAEGSADCYPRFAPTMEWDTAAGQAICEHAGFKVIDLKSNKKMLYNRKKLLNNWFLVQ
jgi:3'(2'), 5'-bisphosphate nucleotidase